MICEHCKDPKKEIEKEIFEVNREKICYDCMKIQIKKFSDDTIAHLEREKMLLLIKPVESKWIH